MKAVSSKLDRVLLQDAWRHESRELTPWLAESEKLMILAGTIGLSGLECVAVAHSTRLLQNLGDLGRGNCLTQRRGNVNDRKAISDVRKFLKTYTINPQENPFHEFEDGWGIKFHVNYKIGRRQVKAIEDKEFTYTSNNDSPFTYQDDIDSFEDVWVLCP